MARGQAVTALLLAASLAACVPGGGSKATDQAIYSCKRDTNAPGQYFISAGKRDDKGLPLVKAGPGGTLRGEILISECLAQRLPAAAPARSPAPAPAAAPAQAGKLPLPTAYPLLPGDAALWRTLTPDQQGRALLFLQDGSTIQASLRTD